MGNTDREQTRVSFSEIIIIIALVFSPFTALRFSFFGISEVLFIFFCGIYIYINKGTIQLPEDSSGKYYVAFIITTIVGWAYNIISGMNSGTTKSAVFNLSSYIITGVTLICVECSIHDEKIRIRAGLILKSVFVSFGIVSILLYIISLTRSSILSYPLRYYQYFSPLSYNLHQYAMFALPLPFVGLYFMSCEKTIIRKVIFIVFSIIYAYLNYSTGSEKALIGLVVGGITFLIAFIINLIEDSFQKALLVIFSLIIMAAFVVLNIDSLLDISIKYFISVDNSGSRQHLYLSAVRIILNQSPLVGLGPSVHVRLASGELYDAHETFLAAGLSGGLIGMLFIIIFMITTTKRVIKNPYLLAAMVPIYVYALGGDLLRKLSVWTLFIMLSYADTNEEHTTNIDCASNSIYIK